MPRPPGLTIHPLTPSRWKDLERLFGPRGACAGCWCMWHRIPRAEWNAGQGDGNRRAFERYVKGGNVPGLLAYDGREPVGWVAVEPREAYPRLERSRILARVDDVPVWSITCFYVARGHRGAGVTRALVDAAVRHARGGGARAVEAYPVEIGETTGGRVSYRGAPSTFFAAGFQEVARRSPARPIVRRATSRRGAGGLTSPPARGARARARGRSTRRSSRTRASASRRDR